jgi:hypothetical protein
MSNQRFHKFLHIDRTCRVYEYSGRKAVIREGDPLPEGEHVVLPQNIRPKDKVTISLRVLVDDEGNQTPVTDEAVYDAEFLSRFFNRAYSVEDRLVLLEEHFGRYTMVKNPGSFLDYLDNRLVAPARILLGGKGDEEARWQGKEGRVLLDWIQKQRDYIQEPIAGRKKKSKAQALSTASQLAVVYYLHKGEVVRLGWTVL